MLFWRLLKGCRNEKVFNLHFVKLVELQKAINKWSAINIVVLKKGWSTDSMRSSLLLCRNDRTIMWILYQPWKLGSVCDDERFAGKVYFVMLRSVGRSERVWFSRERARATVGEHASYAFCGVCIIGKESATLRSLYSLYPMLFPAKHRFINL